MSAEVAYTDYMTSEGWRTRRRAALFAANYRCVVCNSANFLEVHHRSYQNLGHELPGDLTVLCRRCHRLFHQHGVLAK